MSRGPRSRPASPRVGIREVAAAAGVSTATVSYVLNDTPGQTITEATRAKVRQTAAELGYIPHSVARTLRAGHSRIVLLNTGALLPGNSLESLIAGMSEELRRHDHVLLVTTESRGVDASVLASVSPRSVIDLTTVIMGTEADDPISGVTQGYHAGMAFHTRRQLQYLAERGHRRVAFALPDRAGDLGRTRLSHARQVARESGITRLAELHVAPNPQDSQFSKRTIELVENSDITAIAAFDDDTALTVLAGMRRAGYRAPRDLAVMGFDEGRHAALWDPPLTTVRINATAYGRRAARIALGLEAGQWTQPPSAVVVGQTV